MVIQWHRRVGTGIKMRLSFFSPQSKSHALRDLALRFQFHIHIWSYPQATSATVIVFTLSPNTHTRTFELFRRESQNHNNVYADDGFNDGKRKRPIAQTPNKFYH